MTKITRLLSPALVAALVLSQTGILHAQSPAASDRIVIKDGTDVKLRFTELLSSKTAHVGDPVTLELADDLKVNGVTVAREGARALGEVTAAQKAGMLGKGGDLAMQLYYLKIDDNKIKLRGTKGKEGDSKLTQAIVLTVIFGVVGLLKHGKNAEVPAGTTITAYVAEDAPLPLSASAASLEQGAGQVSVTSDPAGGEIGIDGKFFGNAPAVLALTPGEHKIKVSSPGKAWKKTLTVSAGSRLVVTAVLEDLQP